MFPNDHTFKKISYFQSTLYLKGISEVDMLCLYAHDATFLKVRASTPDEIEMTNDKTILSIKYLIHSPKQNKF